MDRPTIGLERTLLRQIPLAQKALRGTWYSLIEGFGLVGFVDNRFRHPFELLGRIQLRRQIRHPRKRDS